MKRYLKKVVFCTKDRPWQINGSSDGVLYVVDTKQGLDLIKGMGLPVLAWLREGNESQDLSGAAYAVESPNELDMDFYEKVYRRERGIPCEILDTERCLIREMIPEDAYAFENIYREASVGRYLKDFHYDAAGEAAYIREYQAHYRFYEYGVWSIVLKETGEVIGRAGFSEPDTEKMDPRWLDTEAGKDFAPCMGYMIGVPWQRKGLALEVCKAILRYAKDELEFKRIQLLIEDGNDASLALSRKLGFTDVGTVWDGDGCHLRLNVLSLV